MKHLQRARLPILLLGFTSLLAGGCTSGTTQSFRPDPSVACTIQEFPIIVELDQTLYMQGYQVSPTSIALMLGGIDRRPFSALRVLGTARTPLPVRPTVLSGDAVRPFAPIELESGRHVLGFKAMGLVFGPNGSMGSPGITPVTVAATGEVEVELITGENYCVTGEMAGRWLRDGFVLKITEETTGRVLASSIPLTITSVLPDI